MIAIEDGQPDLEKLCYTQYVPQWNVSSY